MKRTISLLLAVLLAATFFSACGADSNVQTDTSDTASSSSNSSQTSVATTVEQSTTAETIKLPSVELKNKTISVYNFDENLESFKGTEKQPSWADLLKKEYGAEIKLIPFLDWGQFGTKLAALSMSNDMPDILQKFDFPFAVADQTIQPLNDVIDFSDPLWDDTRNLLDKTAWKGKYYAAPTVKPQSGTGRCLYFNPQLFEDNNVKSPLEYYKENNWDYNVALEIAKTLTQDTNGDGKNDLWGIGISNAGADLWPQTGVALGDIDADGNIVLNYSDPKITASANYYRSLGPAQYNVLIQADSVNMRQLFTEGKLAMFTTWLTNGGSDVLKGLWAKGGIDVVPLPKWPGESTNYAVNDFNWPGICNKAKNVEGAALAIQLMRYVDSKAYSEKYPPENASVEETFKEWGVNDEQLKRLMDINNENVPLLRRGSCLYLWNDGFSNVLTKPWSQVVAELEPPAKESNNAVMERLKKLPN